MGEHYSVDQGRAYIHKSCGSTTIISGNDFSGLCNPFALCLGTVCANCGPDSTSRFTWEDTGETVSRFRRRIRSASPLFTIWTWLIAPILGGVIGAMVMSAFKGENVDPSVATAIGATIGAVAMLLFIAPTITGIIAGGRFYDQR